MDLIKEEIYVDKNIANEAMQLMLEGEIIVPDTKGDLADIISQRASCFVSGGDISGNRLNFTGNAEVCIIYLTKDNSVEGMNGNIDINDFISIDNISPESKAQLEGNVVNLECRVVNERKIAYKALVEVKCAVYDTYNGDVVADVEDLPVENMFVKKICHTNLLSKKQEFFTVKEQIKIDRDKPNIENVVDVVVQPVNINASCVDDGVSISGDLKVTLVYNGQEGGNPLEVYSDEIPINGTIEVEGANDTMICCPMFFVKQLFYNVLADDDGESRILEIECEICVYTNTFAEVEKMVVEDAYCLDRMLQLETQEIQAFKVVCMNKSQYPVKQPIETDGEDMLQIYCATGKATVDNIEVKADKTVVEGVLEVCVLYVTGNDESPVCSFKGDIPFSQTLETRGSNENMTAVVYAAPQHIGFNMLSQREVEIRGMLSVNCVVIENKVFNAVTDITETPFPEGFLDKLPSITVYVVKKGDTLWKLAKRFNTTVNDIVQLNNIENPDLIYPGERLVILKGAA